MEYSTAARLPRAELDTSARKQTLAAGERPNSSASASHEFASCANGTSGQPRQKAVDEGVQERTMQENVEVARCSQERLLERICEQIVDVSIRQFRGAFINGSSALRRSRSKPFCTSKNWRSGSSPCESRAEMTISSPPIWARVPGFVSFFRGWAARGRKCKERRHNRLSVRTSAM